MLGRKKVHRKPAVGIRSHVKGTSPMRISFRRGVIGGSSLQIFVSADHPSKAADRRSILGGAVVCGGGCISCSSRTQGKVTLPSRAAKYVATVVVLKKVLFSRHVLFFELPDGGMPCIQSLRTTKLLCNPRQTLSRTLTPSTWTYGIIPS